jgi:hypothetical protein
MDSLRSQLSTNVETDGRRVRGGHRSRRPCDSRVRWVGLAALAATASFAGSCARAEGASHRNAAVDSTTADSIARARQDSINRSQPGYVIDSARTPEEDLRRFRDALGGTPAIELQGGSATRNDLVRRLVSAVRDRDTVQLRAMVLTAREFADVVYPSSPYMHPPYAQPAALMWMQIANGSVRGFTRLIRRRGGVPFVLDSYECEATPNREGRNVLWSGCVVRLSAPGYGTVAERWFGSIIERDGRFKFVSYANQF